MRHAGAHPGGMLDTGPNVSTLGVETRSYLKAQRINEVAPWKGARKRLRIGLSSLCVLSPLRLCVKKKIQDLTQRRKGARTQRRKSGAARILLLKPAVMTRCCITFHSRIPVR